MDGDEPCPSLIVARARVKERGVSRKVGRIPKNSTLYIKKTVSEQQKGYTGPDLSITLMLL